MRKYFIGVLTAFLIITYGALPGNSGDTSISPILSLLLSAGNNVVVVAKGGGNFTSVQAAINSINDASASNTYLVWIAPGVYNETVTLKPHVHLQGAGQAVTIITSAVGGGTFLPTEATLILASNSSVRDLTLGNTGTGAYNIALLATGGTTQTEITHVTAHTTGSGSGNNYGVYLYGPGTSVTFLDIAATAENSTYNVGLYNYYGSSAILRGGFFTGRGGTSSQGIGNGSSGSTIDAEGVTALAESGTSSNYGLTNGGQATAILRGGSFTGQGGDTASGIYSYNINTTMIADYVTALASGGVINNGLRNSDRSMITLHGGSFTGRDGTAHGIYNINDAILKSYDVSVLGEDGTSNFGLRNDDGATATLFGGSFVAQGGTNSRGVHSEDDSTYLEATRITARAKSASTSNRALESSVGADVEITQSVLDGASYSVVTTGGGGPVSLTNSRLITGSTSGNVTCTAVSRGTTFNSNGCP